MTISVLIVDDSTAARRACCDLLREDPEIRIFGQAYDPYEAVQKMRSALPDVILLDIELPRMNGLTFLSRIMAQRPIPVVIFSGHSDTGSASAIKALELGACEVIGKPKLGNEQARAETQVRLRDAVHAAAQVGRIRGFGNFANKPAPEVTKPFSPGPKLTADAILPPRRPGGVPPQNMQPIVAIGASTGGTEALSIILPMIARTAAPIVIVQHMPEKFTNAFAKRLDRLSEVTVREAQEGDAVACGTVLIAPGDQHLIVGRAGKGYRISIVDGPQVSRHRPSVDVLFRSVAQAAGPSALGVLLTGMGDDGAAGLLEMKQAGADTLVQDQRSSVVWGMPGEAWKLGAAARAVALKKVPDEIARYSAKIRA